MNNMLSMLQSISNPQAFVENYIKSNNNPLLQNAFNMCKNGNTDGLMNLAKNVMKNQGRDFDSEFSNFRAMFNK